MIILVFAINGMFDWLRYAVLIFINPVVIAVFCGLVLDPWVIFWILPVSCCDQ